MAESPLVSIVMGSDSDLEIMNEAAKALDDFGIAYEIDVTSAHRSPARTSEYARNAAGRPEGRLHAAGVCRGIKVIRSADEARPDSEVSRGR